MNNYKESQRGEAGRRRRRENSNPAAKINQLIKLKSKTKESKKSKVLTNEQIWYLNTEIKTYFKKQLEVQK